MIGRSRVGTAKIVKRADFPPPIEELPCGRIWDAEAVREWAKEHPKRKTVWDDRL